MFRTYFLVACVVLSGCATYNQDAIFVNAAKSWEGGNIRDMIAAWGRPNEGFVEPSTYMDGIAQWGYEEKPRPNPYATVKPKTTCYGHAPAGGGEIDVDCDTRDANSLARTSYDLGQQAGKGLRSKCHVTAEFDSSGTITRVTASAYLCGLSDPEGMTRKVDTPPEDLTSTN